MKNNNFYSAKEVAEILGRSTRTEHLRIQQVNKELEDKGYMVENGEIPKRYFRERHPLCLRREKNERELNKRTIQC